MTVPTTAAGLATTPASLAVTPATPVAAVASLPAQLSPGRLLVLALLPGVLITAAFVLLAPVVESIGFPAILALLLAILFVLIPIELGVVLRAGRGTGSAGSALGAIPYRQRIPPRTWAWLVPVLVLVAFLGFGLHQAIEPQLIKGLFGWIPEWFVMPIALDRVGEFSAFAWLVTLTAYFALNSFAGPIVEELYFRGYLLPRMQWLGRWSPLVNVSLFSLYHFWSPWQLFARILGIGPTVYAVQRTRNVYLGMVVHCTLNTIGVLLVASMVLAEL